MATPCHTPMVPNVASPSLTCQVHRNVLDLVYAQTLFWFSFFYAPLMAVAAVCFYFFIFYIKVNSMIWRTMLKK
jgi:hypothetical protein